MRENAEEGLLHQWQERDKTRSSSNRSVEVEIEIEANNIEQLL